MIFFFLFLSLAGIYILISLSPVLYGSNSEKPNKTVILTGHRGAAGTAPENTLAAIKTGLKNKVDRIEIDVQQTKDGIVIVLHDESIDRTTNGKGMVKDMNYNEISQFYANKGFEDKFPSEKIPTLEQVLETINKKAVLLIEIKEGYKLYPDIERNILKIIQKHNAFEWCIIQSFNDYVLDTVHALNSDIKLHKLLVGKLPFLPVIYDVDFKFKRIKDYDFIEEFGIYTTFCTSSFIKKAHSSGKKVNVWTVREKKEYNQFINLGVDGIITDFPEFAKRTD